MQEGDLVTPRTRPWLLVDEFDVEKPMIERLDSGAFRVNGRVPIADLAQAADIELPDGDWDTVGGLIFNTLGHVPEVGEAVEAAGFRLRVERMEGRRITRVRLTRTAAS